MAEVVILELVLDPSKMVEGAKAASDALGGLGEKAKQSEEQFTRSGNALRSAFMASSGGIQVAQGITSTAAAFGQLNTQAALFGASHTILELGKTAENFRKLGDATGAAGGAFGLLSAAWKASPIGVIATAIGLAAAAMSFFGSETDKTTKSVERQTTQLDAYLAKIPELQFRARFGEADSHLTAAGTVNAMWAVRAQPGGMSARSYEKSDVERMFGLELGEAERYYAQAGLREEAVNDPNRKLSGYDVESMGTLIWKERRAAEARMKDAEAKKAKGTAANQQDWREGQRDITKQVEQAQKEMDELIAKGRQFGATIGDAFFNVASGAQSARQAIAGLIADMARAASREAFAGIFGKIAGGFGATPAQTGANWGGMKITTEPLKQ